MREIMDGPNLGLFKNDCRIIRMYLYQVIKGIHPEYFTETVM